MTTTHTVTNFDDPVTKLVKSALECGVPYDGAVDIANYVIKKWEPGGFIEAVLANDLVGACSRADISNIQLLKEYARFLFVHVPRNCWGSYETVNAWLSHEKEQTNE